MEFLNVILFHFLFQCVAYTVLADKIDVFVCKWIWDVYFCCQKIYRKLWKFPYV